MDGEGSRGGPPRFEKLNDDYRTWSVYCKAYLQDRGVLHMVETPRPVVGPVHVTAQPPEGADPDAWSAAHAAACPAVSAHEKQVKELAVWQRKEEIALSNIKMSVKKHLLGMLEDCETAAEAWDTLRALFEDDTTSRRANLEDAMNALESQPGEAMIKYVGRAKTLRNELATAGMTIDEHSL